MKSIRRAGRPPKKMKKVLDKRKRVWYNKAPANELGRVKKRGGVHLVN